MDLSDALDFGGAPTTQQAGQLENPAWPGQPYQPTWPGQQPGMPAGPGQPNAPAWPGQPGQPTMPAWPGQPGQPTMPAWPGQPGQPTMPAWPGQPGQPTAPPTGWPGPAPPTAPQNVPNVPLTVPYEIPLPSGVYDRMVITIQGEVKPNASKLTINLNRNQDTAFHFNPRFNEDGRQVIVRNTMINNIWGKEERAIPSFPFVPGKPFEIKILCTPTEFKVAVDKNHLLEFKHRIRELNQINKLGIYYDVTLTSVKIDTL